MYLVGESTIPLNDALEDRTDDFGLADRARTEKPPTQLKVAPQPRHEVRQLELARLRVCMYRDDRFDGDTPVVERRELALIGLPSTVGDQLILKQLVEQKRRWQKLGRVEALGGPHLCGQLLPERRGQFLSHHGTC